MRPFRIGWIMWAMLGILELLLGLRLVIKLIAVDPGSGLSIFVNGITEVIIAPFGTILGMPAFEGSVFEMSILVAMGVYALLFWIIISVNGPLLAQVTKNTQETESDHTERMNS